MKALEKVVKLSAIVFLNCFKKRRIRETRGETIFSLLPTPCGFVVEPCGSGSQLPTIVH
jgi:hypothetical protein